MPKAGRLIELLIWLYVPFSRHHFKNPLKSAANLIFVIKWFPEFFEGVQGLGGCCGLQAGTGFSLGFGEAVRYHDLPTRATVGGASIGCYRGEFWVYVRHKEYSPNLRLAPNFEIIRSKNSQIGAMDSRRMTGVLASFDFSTSSVRCSDQSFRSSGSINV